MKAILVSALMLISTHIFAQKNFEFGIKINPQTSTLMNKDDANSSDLSNEYPITFLSGGVTLGYNFNNYSGLEIDGLFSRQGQVYAGVSTNDPNAYSRIVALQSELADEKLSSPYQARAELNCIKIPVMYKLMTDNTQKFFYMAMAGPQLNMIYDVAQEVNGEDHFYPGLDIEPQDLYKKFTLDGVVSFGVGVNLGDHYVFTAQARFDYGFQDVENKDMTYTYKGQTNHYFSESRSGNHNATAGLSLSISYK
jgi:hypothetical protein